MTSNEPFDAQAAYEQTLRMIEESGKDTDAQMVLETLSEINLSAERNTDRMISAILIAWDEVMSNG